MSALLLVSEATKRFGGLQALSDVNLSEWRGQDHLLQCDHRAVPA